MDSLRPEAVRQIVAFFLERAEKAFHDPVFDTKLFEDIANEARKAFPESSKVEGITTK